MNLRAYARAQICQVRLPGVCNHNPETTVLAHARIAGISSLGMKAADLLATWCCSSCHAYADTHHDAETKAAFYEGVLRTQSHLIDEGWVKW